MDSQHPLLVGQVEDDPKLSDPKPVKSIVATTDRFQGFAASRPGRGAANGLPGQCRPDAPTVFVAELAKLSNRGR